MAKCLVGAAGGGKVTVTGLTADAVKKGATVTVKQGAKTVASVAGSFNPFVGDYGQVLLMWWGSNAGGYQPSAGSITYSVFPKSSKAVPKSPINGNSGTITIPGATFPPGEYTVISSGGSNNNQNNLLLTETSGRIATVKQHGMNTAKINVSSQQWIGFCNLTDRTGAGGVIIVRNS